MLAHVVVLVLELERVDGQVQSQRLEPLYEVAHVSVRHGLPVACGTENGQ